MVQKLDYAQKAWLMDGQTNRQAQSNDGLPKKLGAKKK